MAPNSAAPIEGIGGNLLVRVALADTKLVNDVVTVAVELSVAISIKLVHVEPAPQVSDAGRISGRFVVQVAVAPVEIVG